MTATLPCLFVSHCTLKMIWKLLFERKVIVALTVYMWVFFFERMKSEGNAIGKNRVHPYIKT